MPKRRALSPMKRLNIFTTAEGRCHICGIRIQVGQKWDAEHVIPLALGGADDDSNLRPAHKACHGVKTRTDAASWSKAKRAKAKHLGIRKRSTFPGGRDSPWKMKIGGRPERRT